MCHIWTTGKLFIDSYNGDRDNLIDKIFFGNIPPSADIYFNYYDENYWCLLNWLFQVFQKKHPYVPYLKKIISVLFFFNARNHLVSKQPFLWEHFNLQQNWRIFQRLPDRSHQVVMVNKKLAASFWEKGTNKIILLMDAWKFLPIQLILEIYWIFYSGKLFVKWYEPVYPLIPIMVSEIISDLFFVMSRASIL